MKRLSIIISLLILATFMCLPFSNVSEANQSITSQVEEVSDSSLGKSSNAFEKTKQNVNKKEEDIARYTEACGGNRTNGIVLYYLGVARDYSIPVIFVGLVIASLNFFIIGNRKLEKREQGFKMLVTLIVGLIVFQVLPLLFAIIVAGR